MCSSYAYVVVLVVDVAVVVVAVAMWILLLVLTMRPTSQICARQMLFVFDMFKPEWGRGKEIEREIQNGKKEAYEFITHPPDKNPIIVNEKNRL